MQTYLIKVYLIRHNIHCIQDIYTSEKIRKINTYYLCIN